MGTHSALSWQPTRCPDTAAASATTTNAALAKPCCQCAASTCQELWLKVLRRATAQHMMKCVTTPPLRYVPLLRSSCSVIHAPRFFPSALRAITNLRRTPPHACACTGPRGHGAHAYGTCNAVSWAPNGLSCCSVTRDTLPRQWLACHLSGASTAAPRACTGPTSTGTLSCGTCITIPQACAKCICSTADAVSSALRASLPAPCAPTKPEARTASALHLDGHQALCKVAAKKCARMSLLRLHSAWQALLRKHPQVVERSAMCEGCKEAGGSQLIQASALHG